MLWCQTKGVNWSYYSSVHPEGLRFFICRECHLIFKDPRVFPSEEQELGHYLKHRNHEDDHGYRDFLRRLADPLCENLDEGIRGLDFGCGPTTLLARILEERGFPCAAYDPYFFPDPELLETQYDFMTCSEVIEHFHDPASEFERIASLIRAHGSLAIMTEPPPTNFATWYYHLDPTHVCFYSPRSFEWICRRWGFSIRYAKKSVVILKKEAT